MAYEDVCIGTCCEDMMKVVEKRVFVFVERGWARDGWLGEKRALLFPQMVNGPHFRDSHSRLQL